MPVFERIGTSRNVLLIPTDVDHRFRRMSSTSVRPRWGAPGTPACGKAGGEGCRHDRLSGGQGDPRGRLV